MREVDRLGVIRSRGCGTGRGGADGEAAVKRLLRRYRDGARGPSKRGEDAIACRTWGGAGRYEDFSRPWPGRSLHGYGVSVERRKLKRGCGGRGSACHQSRRLGVDRTARRTGGSRTGVYPSVHRRRHQPAHGPAFRRTEPEAYMRTLRGYWTNRPAGGWTSTSSFNRLTLTLHTGRPWTSNPSTGQGPGGKRDPPGSPGQGVARSA